MLWCRIGFGLFGSYRILAHYCPRVWFLRYGIEETATLMLCLGFAASKLSLKCVHVGIQMDRVRAMIDIGRDTNYGEYGIQAIFRLVFAQR